MKLKTRKSALKRIKYKKNLLFFKKAYKGHLLRKKNSKRIRRLSRYSLVHKADCLVCYKMLPYK